MVKAHSRATATRLRTFPYRPGSPLLCFEVEMSDGRKLPIIDGKSGAPFRIDMGRVSVSPNEMRMFVQRVAVMVAD